MLNQFIHFSGSEKIVQMLVNRGAKIRRRNNEEATPLHKASSTTAGKLLYRFRLLILSLT